MPSFTITSTTVTSRQDMSGTDVALILADGTLSVSANAQSIRFNGPTTGAVINNLGTIENLAVGGRAIRIESSAGASPVVKLSNFGSGIIQSNDDAFQIQAGTVTGGTVEVINNGFIKSTVGQALDFAGGTGAAVQDITNEDQGEITSESSDAVRIGGLAPSRTLSR